MQAPQVDEERQGEQTYMYMDYFRGWNWPASLCLLFAFAGPSGLFAASAFMFINGELWPFVPRRTHASAVHIPIRRAEQGTAGEQSTVDEELQGEQTYMYMDYFRGCTWLYLACAVAGPYGLFAPIICVIANEDIWPFIHQRTSAHPPPIGNSPSSIQPVHDGVLREQHSQPLLPPNTSSLESIAQTAADNRSPREEPQPTCPVPSNDRQLNPDEDDHLRDKANKLLEEARIHAEIVTQARMSADMALAAYLDRWKLGTVWDVLSFMSRRTRTEVSAKWTVKELQQRADQAAHQAKIVFKKISELTEYLNKKLTTLQEREEHEEMEKRNAEAELRELDKEMELLKETMEAENKRYTEAKETKAEALREAVEQAKRNAEAEDQAKRNADAEERREGWAWPLLLSAIVFIFPGSVGLLAVGAALVANAAQEQISQQTATTANHPTENEQNSSQDYGDWALSGAWVWPLVRITGTITLIFPEPVGLLAVAAALVVKKLIWPIIRKPVKREIKDLWYVVTEEAMQDVAAEEVEQLQQQ